MKWLPISGLAGVAISVAVSVAWAQGDEVSALVVYKAAWHQQTDEGDPVPLPPSDGPFDVFAQAYLSELLLNDPDALSFIAGMTLRTPSGRVEAMEFDAFSGAFFFGAEAVSSQGLNLRYGAGNYRFTLSSFLTGDSSFSLALGEDEYPPAPKVTNFPAAQTIDPASDFTLEWIEFTGGGDREIWVEVFEATDGTGVYQLGPLPGTVRQGTIPAGTLQAERDYLLRLTFTRYTQADDSVVPAVYTAFEAYNTLPARAMDGELPKPSSFTGWKKLLNGDLELTIACAPRRPLTVEGTVAVGSAWQTLASVMPASSPVTVVVTAATLSNRQVIRARQP